MRTADVEAAYRQAKERCAEVGVYSDDALGRAHIATDCDKVTSKRG